MSTVSTSNVNCVSSHIYMRSRCHCVHTEMISPRFYCHICVKSQSDDSMLLRPSCSKHVVVIVPIVVVIVPMRRTQFPENIRTGLKRLSGNVRQMMQQVRLCLSYIFNLKCVTRVRVWASLRVFLYAYSGRASCAVSERLFVHLRSDDWFCFKNRMHWIRVSQHNCKFYIWMITKVLSYIWLNVMPLYNTKLRS